MKAENILKSDVLDIIFQNKNKEYGAYQLRKYYPSRLKKSIGITFLLVLIFAGLQSWKTPKKVSGIELGLLQDVTLIDYKPPTEKPKEIEKNIAAKKPMAQVADFVPLIVKDLIDDEPIPTNEQKDTSSLGGKTLAGPASTGLVGVEPGDPKEKVSNTKTSVGDAKDPEDDEPIFNPSNMPEFPGGMEAMRNFMLKNLRQPDDIEEGQKFVVIAKFVVDKEGNISNVEMVQNGREDLDDEVRRVINKMPKWKPGLQNGNPVAVYFKMPVTFVNNG